MWGSLASFGARAYPGTKKWYGTSGNSFVAVVEFGDTVRARAVTAGRRERQSGVPALQRSGQALQHGRPARSLLLPRSDSKGTRSGSTIPEAESPRRIFMDNKGHTTRSAGLQDFLASNGVMVSTFLATLWPAQFSCLY